MRSSIHQPFIEEATVPSPFQNYREQSTTLLAKRQTSSPPNLVNRSLRRSEPRQHTMGGQCSESISRSSRHFAASSIPNFDTQFCYCGLQCRAKTATTVKNYGRMFYACPRYQIHRCVTMEVEPWQNLYRRN